jgi:hypothetical protein
MFSLLAIAPRRWPLICRDIFALIESFRHFSFFFDAELTAAADAGFSFDARCRDYAAEMMPLPLATLLPPMIRHDYFAAIYATAAELSIDASSRWLSFFCRLRFSFISPMISASSISPLSCRHCHAIDERLSYAIALIFIFAIAFTLSTLRRYFRHYFRLFIISDFRY